MKFYEKLIAGVFVIQPEPFADARGMFRRHFCAGEFSRAGIDPTVSQANISANPHALTLRGFHYQREPFAEAKTLSCLGGAIYDVVLDLRPRSCTYKRWLSFQLSSDMRSSIHVPRGCANAFLTLEPDTLVHYYCSAPYAPDAERGVRYDDPAFGVRWPAVPLHISDKDRSFPDFTV